MTEMTRSTMLLIFKSMRAMKSEEMSWNRRPGVVTYGPNGDNVAIQMVGRQRQAATSRRPEQYDVGMIEVRPAKGRHAFEIRFKWISHDHLVAAGPNSRAVKIINDAADIITDDVFSITSGIEISFDRLIGH